MFTDSDFEIDEEFLNDAFENKASTTGQETPTGNILINNNSFRNVNNPPSSKLGVGRDSRQRLLDIPTTSVDSWPPGNHGSHPRQNIRIQNTKFPQVVAFKPTLLTGSTELSVTPKASNFGARVQIRHRKFPGPAGLLPDKPEKHMIHSLDTSTLNTSLADVNENPSDHSTEVICSQNTNTNFNEGPWLRLSSDYDRSESSQLANYNVAWIKRRATSRQLIGRKVPFLAVVLKHIDFFSVDPSVVLEDETGIINGTLHRDVVEEYASHLKSGSALVLHQMGVVSAGFPTRRHYLNITLNNVIAIYDCPSEGSSNVRVTRVRDVSMNHLEQLIKSSEMQLINSPSNSPQLDQTPLFNSITSTTVNPSSRQAQFRTSLNPDLCRSTTVSSPHYSSGDSCAKPSYSGMKRSNDSVSNNRPTYPHINESTTYKTGGNFVPKVPRLSESPICKNQQPVHGNVKSTENVSSLMDGEKQIVEGIFQGFDCSSLFDDF